jgi:magnesium chelatase subunit H
MHPADGAQHPRVRPVPHALRLRGARGRQAGADAARSPPRGAPGTLPRTVALALWGCDNIKSEGTQVSPALAPIGARPRLDRYARPCGTELIPLEELGRPRIDTLITPSGIFRDLLPMQSRCLAEAAHPAAIADDPDAMNPTR